MKLKKYLLSTYIVCILLLSCNASKAIKSNTNLLQGSWELIYISGSKIAFEGLFPNKKPNIVFDLDGYKFVVPSYKEKPELKIKEISQGSVQVGVREDQSEKKHVLGKMSRDLLKDLNKELIKN